MPWSQLIQVVKRHLQCKYTFKTMKSLIVYYNDIFSSIHWYSTIVNIGKAETEASDIITPLLSPLLQKSDISFFVDP